MNEKTMRAIEHAANQMSQAATVEETLQVIAASAAEAIPSFEHISVTTRERSEVLTTRAATSDLARELDAVQYGLGEGPCVDAIAQAGVVVAAHLKIDQRWSNYVPEAVALGVKSQMGVRFHLENGGTLGGLNLYSTVSEVVDGDDVAAAAAFAMHAALALGQAHEVAGLSRAVESRQSVGQAIGILMERYRMDETAAHAFLWRASSTSNIKVRDVAATLVEEANVKAGRPTSQ